jgi:hypothetical protein
MPDSLMLDLIDRYSDHRLSDPRSKQYIVVDLVHRSAAAERHGGEPVADNDYVHVRAFERRLFGAYAASTASINGL